MVNNSMFGTLHDYQNQEYFEKHPYMWIITPDAAYRLDIIAGIITPSDSDAYDLFNSQEELHTHLEYALSQSAFDAGEVDVESIRHVVTLSTCSYEYATARFDINTGFWTVYLGKINTAGGDTEVVINDIGGIESITYGE